ncbi:MAG: hypothetical protein BJ554DRAFT_6986, partial [Olpidium bornovanus]
KKKKETGIKQKAASRHAGGFSLACATGKEPVGNGGPRAGADKFPLERRGGGPVGEGAAARRAEPLERCARPDSGRARWTFGASVCGWRTSSIRIGSWTGRLKANAARPLHRGKGCNRVHEPRPLKAASGTPSVCNPADGRGSRTPCCAGLPPRNGNKDTPSPPHLPGVNVSLRTPGWAAKSAVSTLALVKLCVLAGDVVALPLTFFFFSLSLPRYRLRARVCCFLIQLAVDLLNPSAEHEKRTHKLKRLVQSPNSYFMDVKCPGSLPGVTWLRFWKAHESRRRRARC